MLGVVIAGDGDDRSYLEELVERAEVKEQVQFAGHVPDQELPDLYRAADLFVMPSTGEGFGIVFLQAVASGVRVMGGDGDGSRDPPRDGRDGVLLYSRVAGEVARAIEHELLSDRGERATERSFERSRFEGFLRRSSRIRTFHLAARWKA